MTAVQPGTVQTLLSDSVESCRSDRSSPSPTAGTMPTTGCHRRPLCAHPTSVLSSCSRGLGKISSPFHYLASASLHPTTAPAADPVRRGRPWARCPRVKLWTPSTWAAILLSQPLGAPPVASLLRPPFDLAGTTTCFPQTCCSPAPPRAVSLLHLPLLCPAAGAPFWPTCATTGSRRWWASSLPKP
jgi:hypothetical protein